MAKEQPTSPPGINRFKKMLGIVASVPKADVDARMAALAKSRKKRRGKK